METKSEIIGMNIRRIHMKGKFIFILCAAALILCGISTSSEAMLIDRGGGLIYDSDLNLTWLQDARYSRTSPDSFGAGYISWKDGMAWTESLVYYDSVRNKYWDDWRMPSAFNRDPNNLWNTDPNDLGPCEGYDCSYSEMGHLYYTSLGNIAGQGGFTNPGPFINLLGGPYWYGEPNQDTHPFYWYFNFNPGWQGLADCHFAWAVMEGDVPEPATLILLGAGVLGLAILRKKRS